MTDDLNDRLIEESHSRYRNVDIAYETTVSIPMDLIDAYVEIREENGDGDRERTIDYLAESVAKQHFREDFDVVGSPQVAVLDRYPYPNKEVKVNLLVKH